MIELRNYGTVGQYPMIMIQKLSHSYGILPQWQYIYIENEDGDSITGTFDYDIDEITEITPELFAVIQDDIKVQADE
jgi:hypothetical protein